MDPANNTKSYRQLCLLSGHELTIVQLAFSNNGDYLLSVSRDRSWKLYKKTGDSYELYRGLSTKNSYHTRIIWSCSWSFDDKYFVTTSRDKRACIWNGEADALNSNEKPLNDAFELSESVTACSIAPRLINNNKE
jgi:elongator complex protein 2